MDPSQTCSAISRAVGEPLLGTAPTASQWLLVEHLGPWERDAVETLPEPARSRVADWMAAGNRRVQLIRRPSRQPSGVGHLVALADIATGRLTGTRARSLETLDIPADGVVLGDTVLVCVHGRRDRCCAEHGRAVADTLAMALPEIVWETTHLGGHRFAATAAVLPTGRVLGRLRPDTVLDTVEAARAGEPTDHDRGQAGISEREQVVALAGSAEPGDDLLRPASCGADPVSVTPWIPGSRSARAEDQP